MPDTFKALMLTQDDAGKTVAEIRRLSDADLPEGDVLVAVDYSSLNYKDGLAITGKGKIVRTWPMVPGVDLAGTVLQSDSSDYAAGDKVVLTGWSVGEKYWGGYSQRQRVQSKWLVPLPEGLDSQRAMAIGTAGFTAMLCVMTLEQAGVTPDKGTVLVTGASGGVGSAAVQLAKRRGAHVTALASAAKLDELRALGADEVVDRNTDLVAAIGSNSIDVVVDLVAGDGWPALLEVLKRGGRYVTAGAIAGPLVELDVRTLYLKDLTLIGCTFQDDVVFTNLVGYIEADEIRPLVSATFPLAEIAAAQQQFLQKKFVGKLVLIPPA